MLSGEGTQQQINRKFDISVVMKIVPVGLFNMERDLLRVFGYLYFYELLPYMSRDLNNTFFNGPEGWDRVHAETAERERTRSMFSSMKGFIDSDGAKDARLDLAITFEHMINRKVPVAGAEFEALKKADPQLARKIELILNALNGMPAASSPIETNKSENSVGPKAEIIGEAVAASPVSQFKDFVEQDSVVTEAERAAPVAGAASASSSPVELTMSTNNGKDANGNSINYQLLETEIAYLFLYPCYPPLFHRRQITFPLKIRCSSGQCIFDRSHIINRNLRACTILV